jgi:hypothetical protein
MALNKDSINLFAGILTDHGVQYNAMNVHGPLNKPTLEISDIFSGAFDRISEGLVNLGVDTLSAGVSIAQSGVSIVDEVGSGVLDIGKNLGVSALEIGTGLLKLDGEELQEGLEGATKDTLSLTAGSVKDTGSAGGDGLADSVSDLKGDDRLQAWDREIPARYRTAMQQASDALAKMPYPPVID